MAGVPEFCRLSFSDPHRQWSRVHRAIRLEPYDEGGEIGIRLEGPDVDRPSGLAVPVGTAVHELATTPPSTVPSPSSAGGSGSHGP
jgi:hypothetical protein